MNIINSTKNIKEIDNYENMQIETRNKNKKVIINYAKKIFFFNGKSDEDGQSYDTSLNKINLNKFQTNDLFRNIYEIWK